MRASDSVRRDPRALLALGAVLLAFGAGAAVLERLNPIALRHFVVWRDANAARRIAIEEKRPILYAFLEQNDVRSMQLEREVFADPAIGAELNRTFVIVRSDPKLAAQFGFRTGVVITDAEGSRQTSFGGYRGKAHAIGFLRAAAREMSTPAPEQDAARSFVEALSRIGSAHSPSFSPDGKRIAFIADLSGQPQLWMTDRNGSYPQLVVSMEHGIQFAQWSPDGEWIAFAADGQIHLVHPDGSGLRQVSPSGSSRNLMSGWTRQGLLPLSTAFKNTPSMEASLFDPKTGASRVIARTPAFGVIIDVSCDGESAVILRREGAMRSTIVAGRNARVIAPPADEQTLAAFACSSDDLFAVSNHGRDRGAFVRIRGGRFETLWGRDDAEVVTAAMDDERHTAALVWNRDGKQELALLDLRSGARTSIDLPLTTISEVRFSPDANHLAFTGSDAAKPPDIWLLDLRTKEARQLTRSSHAGVGLEKLVRPQLVRLANFSGWLYRAKGRSAVISLHGGPMQQETAGMNATYQALVAAGITVFAPNVRGSAGFGKRFMSLDDGAARVNAIADVRAAADWLAKNGATRIGVMGESYGGWLALETATRYPHTFAAIVDSYGMTDLRAMIDEAAPEVAPMLTAEYGDDLGELSVDLEAIHTPTLVLHGARDLLVRQRHSDALVRELRRRRVPVEYIVFDNEGHGFREERNRTRAASATVAWFEKHLHPSPEPGKMFQSSR